MKPANQKILLFYTACRFLQAIQRFEPNLDMYMPYIYILKIKVIKIITGQISQMFNFCFIRFCAITKMVSPCGFLMKVNLMMEIFQNVNVDLKGCLNFR